MANLKEIRTRIESVESTQQITTAMRMVSASKLRKAQLAFSAIHPYADELLTLAQEIYATMETSRMDDFEHFIDSSQEPVLDNVLLLALSSNRGLCGSFNSNVTKFVIEQIKTTYETHLAAGKLHLITVGHRSGDVLAKQNMPIISSHDDLIDNVDYKKVSALSARLLKDFQEKTYTRIVLIYNKFRTVLTQEVIEQQFLPIIPPESQTTANQIPTEYIFEPDKESILKSLYPKILSIQLYRIFLESVASEQGARMTAMQQASDNASALLKELKVTYNKERQAAITNELLEIISGSEALNNQ